MQLERRVLGNAASLGVGAVLSQLANFGFVILVARGFGREIFAQYALSMAIGGLACLLVSFGSISLLVRSSAQDLSRSIEMLRSVLPFQIIVGLGIWIVILALGVVFSSTIENLIILGCIVAHHIIIRITAVLLSQLHGQERMHIVAAVKVGRNIATLAAGVALALTTGSAVAGVSAMPVASIFFLLYSGLKVRSLLGPITWRWDPRGAWNVATQAFPFFLIVAVTAACDRMGLLMLSVIQDSDSLATYASGERIITAAAILYSMLTAASIPAASRLALADRARHQKLVNRVARVVFLAVLPAATMLFLFSADIIVFLFGSEFTTSAPVLRIVAWVLVIRGINSVQTMGAVSAGRQRDVLTGRSCALVLLLVLGPPLIWAAGPVGLACTMLGAEMGYAAILHGLLQRAGIGTSPVRSSRATVAACGVTLVVGIISMNLDLISRIALMSGCIVAGLWIFGAVRKHDMKYLFAILKTKRSDYLESI